MTAHVPELYWDATYAIALALIEHFPDRTPESVGLQELIDLIQTLPGFDDDLTIVTDQVLLDIINVWYEETVSL